MFIIGGYYNNNCEVYDSFANKFVFVENSSGIASSFVAVNIGYKIYVFRNVYRNWKEEIKSEMLIFCYNDNQNALNQENNLNLDCKVVRCAKMSKK